MKEVNFEKLNLTYPKPTLIKDLGIMFATENSKKKVRFGLYKCGLCGNEFRTQTSLVKNGNTKSCGCYKKRRSKEVNTKHGLGATRLYNIWVKIKGRVFNNKNKDYSSYGGRGITICDEWKNDFMSFYDWAMSNGYGEELSIDRIDNDGNYEPSNCRWATRTMQSRNQRIRKDNTSGYKGVYLDKRDKIFTARICVNKNRVFLGLFPTAVEGAIAYNNYIIENNLEGYILNEIPERV